MSVSRQRIRHVAVVVPARNEQAWINATLDAIATARAALDGVTTSCIVVLDDCTDATSSLIASRTNSSIVVPGPTVVVDASVRSAGAARAIGFETALRTGAHLPGETWLASTDADTLVPPEWLVSQLLLAESGADAVAGIVELDDVADERLREGFRTRYQLGADGSHRHVHGANMAMRGDAYLAAGGWRSLETGEDHDLWARLGKIGRCISSTDVVVRTSSRLHGRAPAGFAADLLMIHSSESVA